MTTPKPVLTVKHLSKTLVGTTVLDDVSLEVLPGEVHVLMGQNGSGKSTLIKCLSGYWEPDASAEFRVDGQPLPIPYRPDAVRNFGMAFIHQDVGLSPNLTVMENSCLGRGFATGFGGRILWKKEAKRVRQVIAGFGHDISPWTKVQYLSAADKTIVAIARALEATADNGKLLVLDEVTAALPQNEVNRLFATMRRLTERGIGIIYVSHRLKEVFEIGDRVTILRDGKNAGTYSTGELTQNRLVELIVGQNISSYYPPPAPERTGEEVLLKVDGLCGETVKDVSFTVKRDEIVGVAGLIGSGCSEVGRLLFGATKPTSGEIWFRGEKIDWKGPSQAMEAGIGLITEDRHSDGSFLHQTIGQNMTITDVRRFWKRGCIDGKKEREETCQLIDKFQVKPPDPEKTFKHLSGGNQQKVILAKWLRLQLDLLICDEPVRGVDIGSKTEIYKVIEEAAQQGTATLMISTEFEDLAHLCDRVLVMLDGHMVGELSGEQLSEERIAQQVYA